MGAELDLLSFDLRSADTRLEQATVSVGIASTHDRIARGDEEISRRIFFTAIACLAAVLLVMLLPGSAVAGAAGQMSAGEARVNSATTTSPTVRYGVDYSKINVDWTVFFRDLKASGYSFIGRYLPVQGAMQRCVTTAELTAAAAAGVDCFFWFENSNDLYRPRDGYAAGVADAKEALARTGEPGCSYYDACVLYG